MPMHKGVKRVHRLVVLPDYQGIGIGTKFITEIAKLYNKNNYKFNLTTTTPSIVHALIKNNNWYLYRYGHSKGTGWGNNDATKQHLKNAVSIKRVTYSFYYKAK